MRLLDLQGTEAARGRSSAPCWECLRTNNEEFLRRPESAISVLPAAEIDTTTVSFFSIGSC
jgi:hypothetical protein